MTDAQQRVLELFYGRWRSQTMHAGVELGVFEAVGSGPVTAAMVAHDLDLDPALTFRLMRTLAALRLLDAHEGDAFSITEAGAMLRGDHPQSMRDAILLREGPEHTAVWKHLSALVREGSQDGFIREFGAAPFEHAAREPAYRKAFDAGMSSQSNLQTGWALEVLEQCDVASIAHLCDVGGGQGHLLCHLLARYPHLEGTILERPGVLGAGPAPWAARLNVADRCNSVAGDMFVDVPGADAYTMKMILHDWNDDECVRILANLCRRASPSGRVFIIEHVITDGGDPDYAALFDMHMLCWGTGKERTAAEYRALLSEAGWDFSAVRFPRSGAIGVIEAAKAA